MNLLYDELVAIAATGLLVVLALPFASERRLARLFAFVGVAAAQTAVVTAPLLWGWQLGRWNWTGKVASICVGLAAVLLLRLTRKEVGLTWPEGRRAWLVSAAGIGAAVLLFVGLTLVFGADGRPDAETLAYEATMPGLDEELAFRGIGMALLARGLLRPRFGMPAWLLPLVVTSLWFTVVHVVDVEDGRLHLAPLAAVAVLPLGVILALPRVGSGSLLGPLIAHNAANTAAFLMAFALPASR